MLLLRLIFFCGYFLLHYLIISSLADNLTYITKIDTDSSSCLFVTHSSSQNTKNWSSIKSQTILGSTITFVILSKSIAVRNALKYIYTCHDKITFIWPKKNFPCFTFKIIKIKQGKTFSEKNIRIFLSALIKNLLCVASISYLYRSK